VLNHVYSALSNAYSAKVSPEKFKPSYNLLLWLIQMLCHRPIEVEDMII
jgi:hypothetical protein